MTHLAAILGLRCLPFCNYKTLLFAISLWPLTGLGITAGAHRLWSHRSYKATFQLRIFLMILNSIANQGSIYHWSRDHRIHHKYSETDCDPHNAKRGFFFAHVGWLLITKHPDVISAGKKLKLSDLEQDPVVKFQKNLDPWFSLFMCFIFPGVTCVYVLGDSFWYGFLVPGSLRYCFVLHFTWLVNSAAHLWGKRPYDALSNPAENYIVSYLSMGEGWHNWHHRFPYDYAASEYSALIQFNPTKIFIDIFCYLGLASERKRALDAWGILKKSKSRSMTAEAYISPRVSFTSEGSLSIRSSSVFSDHLDEDDTSQASSPVRDVVSGTIAIQ